MQISKDQTAAIKPLLMGAVGGAIALAVVGFSWGGWVTGGTAEKMAVKRAEMATVAALAPLCVENFRKQADAGAQLASFQKLASYEQRGFIEKAGLATAMGSKGPDSSVAQACAETLSKLKAADLG
jgi:hypothetical protein